jgi:hypothetical protein
VREHHREERQHEDAADVDEELHDAEEVAPRSTKIAATPSSVP